MKSKVLIELLRGADSRGIALRDILEKYSIKITPAIFREVMGSVRRSETAVEFFRWAPSQPGFHHDTQTCNSLLRVVVDDRRPGEAYRIFTDLVLPLHNPSVASYNLLVRGYCEAGDVWKALKLLKEMKARDLCPDETTHGWILRGFCVQGRMAEAMEYFRSVVDTSGLDATMYETLIDGFCKVERLDDAFRLVEEMILEIGWIPRSRICCAVVSGLCQVGNFDRANKLFTFVIERATKEDEKEKDRRRRSPSSSSSTAAAVATVEVTLAVANALISELCSAGKVDEALVRVFEKCKAKNVVDAAMYGELIRELCKLKRLEDGLRLLEEMSTSRGFDPDNATYNRVVAGFCEMDMVEQAVEFFGNVTRKRECVPDAALFRTLVEGLCNSGRVFQALELVEEMDRAGCQPNGQIHCLVIEQLCKIGEADKACDLLQKSLRRGCAPANSVTYTTIVQELFKSREPRDAARQLRSILSSGLASPGVVTSCAIIDGLCKSGKFSDARWLIYSMTHSGFKSSTPIQNSFLGGLCKAAKMADACAFFQDMQDESLSTVVSYNILLDGLCKVVKIEEACVVFVDMVNRDFVPTPATYMTLVEGFSRSGRMAEDYQFAEQRDDIPKGLEIILSRIKNLEPGFEVICRMVDRSLMKLATVNEIIRRFCKAGRNGDAENLARTLAKATGISPAIVRAGVADVL